MIRAFLISILLAFYGASAAQEPAYVQYGVEDGLPSSLVYCMLQDSRGFLWFGTDKGLARFDGVRFKVYTIKDGLPDLEVLNMFEDSKGRIWLSCFQKKPCYFYEGEFRTADNDPVLAQSETKSGTYTFFEDEDGSVWIAGRDRKICRYEQKKIICIEPLNHIGLKYMPLLVYIYNGNKYAITESSILRFYLQNNSELIYHRLFNETSITHLPSVAQHRNKIFYMHENKLIVVDLNDENYEIISILLDIPSGEKNICHIDDNNIWLCYISSNNGAIKIEYNIKNNISFFAKNQHVLNTFQATDNSIWFSTFNKGVMSLLEHPTLIFNNTNSSTLKTNNFTALSLSNENILTGDAIGNLYQISSKNVIFSKNTENLTPDKIQQIFTINDTSIIVVMDKHLNIGNKHNYTITYIPSLFKPLKRKRKLGAYKAAYFDGDHFWIGTNQVFLSFDLKTNLTNVFLEEKRITAIGEDLDNNIWTATIDGFLSEKDSFQTNWGEKFKPLSARVLDIKATEKGKLWVATSEHGLVRADIHNGEVLGVELINEKLETPIENIKSLFAAEDGKLWIATSNGAYSLDQNLIVKHFDTSDGLPSNDVNAVAVQKDTLWAATVAGLAKIQLNLPLESSEFPTYISGISYFEGELNIEKDLIYRKENTLQLPAGSSLVELELSGLHYGSQGKMDYTVVEKNKLLPIRYWTIDNIVQAINDLIKTHGYSTLIKKKHSKNYGINVSPMCQEITVTAITKNGVQSSQPDTLILTILPFWHETIWFTLAIIGIAFSIIRYIYLQVTAVKRLQQATIDLQLQAIKAQINPHFIGNSINAIQQFFYPPNPLKASQYISNFTSILHKTMHLSDTALIPFKDELKYISDYLEMVKLRFEDRFQYKITVDEIIDKMNLFPSMILQPILENATIHGLAETGITYIKVDFQKENNLIICTVTDNGIGINQSIKRKELDKKKRPSKGIELINKKINIINTMHDVKLKIDFKDLSEESKNTTGTKVTLTYKELPETLSLKPNN